MLVTFLSATHPLTKRYHLDANNSLQKTSAPLATRVTSHKLDIPQHPTAFHNALQQAAAKGWCVLKGNTRDDLVNQSRAGQTDPSDPTTWVCFDLDGVNYPDPDAFMQAIGLGNVTYTVQYSSSHGIENKPGLRCHIFVQLKTPCSPAFLKLYLKTLNFTIFALANDITLAASGMALKWPLDITTCQNDKLIYIAPPILGDGITDPITQRIALVQKDEDFAEIKNALSEAELTTRQDAMIQTLRANAGLPKRKLAAKVKGSVEFMPGCSSAGTWEMKAERGFVYFNLNGGDSWGYYHPENNPTYIYNFKGEPTYLTSELLPEYWASLRQAASAPTQRLTGEIYFGFRDEASSAYHTLTYVENEITLHRVQNERQLNHWQLEHGMVPSDVIPTWRIAYEPESPVVIDQDRRLINTYRPSPYELEPSRSVATLPPNIQKVLVNALGTPDLLDHFVNWLACVVQFKRSTRTAWLFQGIEGTGKGVTARIVRALLHYANVVQTGLDAVKDDWNDFIERKLMVIVDEMDVEAIEYGSSAMAKLKYLITEPTITINKKFSQRYETENRANFMLFSNRPTPIKIQESDRRFNVGVFQREALSDIDFDVLDAEIGDFYHYLAGYKADWDRATTTIKNEALADLKEASSTAPDIVAKALLAGDLSYFAEFVDEQENFGFSPYNDLIRKIVRERPDRLTRQDLFVLFDDLCGGVPPKKEKFSRYLSHHGIKLKPVRFTNGRLARGIDGLTWKDGDYAWLLEEKKATPRRVA